jgi:hypothetical protein
MKTTKLLPPFTGVRMAWAFTGEFSNDPNSQISSNLVLATLKDLEQKSQSDPLEYQYIISAIATINASRRSLDTVYKGRQLNFDENETLRSAYLEDAEATINFGKQAKDYIISLPAMTIGAATGLTLTQVLIERLGLDIDLAPWLIGLAAAAIGYFINYAFVYYGRKKKLILYVKQDYERDLYYQHYVTRVQTILISLYQDLDRIHNNVFGQAYPIGNTHVHDLVMETLKGVKPTLCPKVHNHIRQNKITPELWPICETGVPKAVRTCPYYKELDQDDIKYIDQYRVP